MNRRSSNASYVAIKAMKEPALKRPMANKGETGAASVDFGDAKPSPLVLVVVQNKTV